MIIVHLLDMSGKISCSLAWAVVAVITCVIGSDTQILAIQEHGDEYARADIEGGRVPFARFLLEHGADPNVMMRNGDTPLTAVLAIGGRQRGYDPDAVVREPPDKLDLIRDLIASGADPNGQRGVPLPGSRVFSPDGQASGLDRGPTDPDNFGVARSWTGATPFWVAAHKADVTLMRLLIDAGADPMLTTDDGTTSLMVAAGLGHAGDRYERFWSFASALEAVTLLVEQGAEVDASNEAGSLRSTALRSSGPMRSHSIWSSTAST